MAEFDIMWHEEEIERHKLQARVKYLERLCAEIGEAASLSVVRMFLWPPGRHYYVIPGEYRQRLLAAGRGLKGDIT